MRTTPLVALLALALCAAPAASAEKKEAKQWDKPPEMKIDPKKQYTAVMETSAGKITIELYPKLAPNHVNSFVFLAKEGYYDGVIFHRVIKDFMLQGGCPQGTGTGGPGYTFEDEFNSHKVVRGALAMANAGPNTNGSQFFIVTADETPWLDGKHTAFGRVVDGMDVVERLGAAQTDARDRPVEPLGIETVELDGQTA